MSVNDEVRACVCEREVKSSDISVREETIFVLGSCSVLNLVGANTSSTMI